MVRAQKNLWQRMEEKRRSSKYTWTFCWWHISNGRWRLIVFRVAIVCMAVKRARTVTRFAFHHLRANKAVVKTLQDGVIFSVDVLHNSLKLSDSTLLYRLSACVFSTDNMFFDSICIHCSMITIKTKGIKNKYFEKIARHTSKYSTNYQLLDWKRLQNTAPNSYWVFNCTHKYQRAEISHNNKTYIKSVSYSIDIFCVQSRIPRK